MPLNAETGYSDHSYSWSSKYYHPNAQETIVTQWQILIWNCCLL